MLKSQVILAALFLSLPVTVPAMAQKTVTNRVQSNASAEYREQARRIFDEGAAAEVQNDAAARLAIYRRALAQLERAPAAMRSDPLWQRDSIFYRSAIFTHRSDLGERDAVLKELPAFLAETRLFASNHKLDDDTALSLAEILRLQTNGAIFAGNQREALALAREGVKLVLDVSTRNPNDQFIRRSLAVDLDNLAEIEAKSGLSNAADQSSLAALDIFRDLAKRQPDVRAANGSVLIALLRRAVNFGEPERIEEARAVIATMRSRGQLVERYRNMAENIDAFESEAQAAKDKKLR